MILDTHTFLWFINGDGQLTNTAKSLIEDRNNRIYLSVASGWEMAIKISQGVMRIQPPLSPYGLDELLGKQCEDNGIELLPITVEALLQVQTLPHPASSGHKDPFDRLIIAQSLTTGMPIIGRDPEFPQCGVTMLW